MYYEYYYMKQLKEQFVLAFHGKKCAAVRLQNGASQTGHVMEKLGIRD